jgi:hypothetical protein
MFLEIKFAGGLGNQLFQYATGRALCIKNNVTWLLLNTENYKNESLGRTFGLSHLHIKGSIIKHKRLQQIFRKNTKFNKLVVAFSFHKTIEEENFSLHQIKEIKGFLTSLNGYWQSPFYFNEIRAVLVNEFTPVNLPRLPEWIMERNTVAVHVRRTDYLTDPQYGFLGVNYYETAMAMIKDRVADPLFIFFSDDIAWCKNTFKNNRIVFCEDALWDKDYLQLHLMTHCTHLVIANSSFSWWGAWLNSNPAKIGIRPATPFKKKNLLYEAHYPEEWIAIKNN